jgi:trypanothione synthetase/amidase
MSHIGIKHGPFNAVLGTFSQNIPTYSNGDDTFFSVERHYFYGIDLGFKWQCVELARRWLLRRKGCLFKQSPNAADIWTDLKSIERVTDGRHFPLSLHPNGSSTAPRPDSFLIYPRSPDMPFGHIAIITDVVPGFIRVAEQNYKFHYWSEDFAREIPLIIKDGLYHLEDEDPISGWMHIEDDNQLTPLDESKMDTVLQQYKRVRKIGSMERCVASLARKNSDRSGSTNENDSSVPPFIEESLDEMIRVEKGAYYKIDHHLLSDIAWASNELHRMFLEATERVIGDDQLLIKFGIPEVFWTRIRQSWADEQDFAVTGRFDLAFDEKQLKVLEYNADSAAALAECAVTQEEWADTVNLPSKFMSAFQLHPVLVRNWKNLEINTRVHLLIEDDPEERLTALYMQTVINEAGIDSKLCITGTNDLQWKDSIIVDSDGQPLHIVWKLWMWETVFKDYIEATTDHDHTKAQEKPIDGERPRLCDILLNDRIRVIEPMWKVITSNKALLPVLCSMFPNQSLLLRTDWTLTDELKKGPFVQKPIVGRCGRNVTLINASSDNVIEENEGNFADRDSIYQELFSLKNYDGYYPIIGSWIVGRVFAGFCIREDKKLITDGDSPIAPCCIIWNDEEDND